MSGFVFFIAIFLVACNANPSPTDADVREKRSAFRGEFDGRRFFDIHINRRSGCPGGNCRRTPCYGGNCVANERKFGCPGGNCYRMKRVANGAERREKRSAFNGDWRKSPVSCSGGGCGRFASALCSGSNCGLAAPVPCPGGNCGVHNRRFLDLIIERRSGCPGGNCHRMKRSVTNAERREKRSPFNGDWRRSPVACSGGGCVRSVVASCAGGNCWNSAPLSCVGGSCRRFTSAPCPGSICGLAAPAPCPGGNCGVHNRRYLDLDLIIERRSGCPGGNCHRMKRSVTNTERREKRSSFNGDWRRSPVPCAGGGCGHSTVASCTGGNCWNSAPVSCVGRSCRYFASAPCFGGNCRFAALAPCPGGNCRRSLYRAVGCPGGNCIVKRSPDNGLIQPV